MSADDEIKERYQKTSDVRDMAINILATNYETLSLTLKDTDSAGLLVRLLDGQDKQTIARQRNKTDEKMVGAIVNVHDVANSVIEAMGGHMGVRGDPNADAAPKEKIKDVEVVINEGELDQGQDDNLTAETLLGHKK